MSQCRTTYDQFLFSNSAINLELVMFAAEKMNSFLVKVHVQPVNPPWPVIRQ